MTEDKSLIGVKRQLETNNILLDWDDRRCGWDLCGKSASEVKLKKRCQVLEVVGLEKERENIRLDADD
jgi:hypothetical protein